MDYYSRYEKYKDCYIECKMDYNYYFMHCTMSIDNLKKILSERVLKLGKNVPREVRKLSGGKDLEYIFLNINFDDLMNIEQYKCLSLLIHPRIVNDYRIVFNTNWQGGISDSSIIIEKNISIKEKKEKIDKIKEAIKNPKDIPQIVLDAPGFRHHEILLEEDLPIDKYLIGVVCHDSDVQEIKEFLKNDKIKIITDTKPLTLDEIFS